MVVNLTGSIIEINQMAEYNNPTPVAVAVIRADTGRFLVLRRTDNGGLAFPGGYLEQFENYESGAARELAEETGIFLSPSMFHLFKSMTNQRNICLGFCGYDELVSENIIDQFVANNEASELMWVDGTTELIFPLHDSVLKSFWVI